MADDYKNFDIADEKGKSGVQIREKLEKLAEDRKFGPFRIGLKGTLGVTSVAMSGLLLYKKVKEIKNDVVRKNLIDDLRRTDPLLSSVSEEQLLEWYATIVHFAPKFSLDKSAVREVLQGFARFGRVDVNTLKMIADTEKAVQQASSSSSSWGSLITDVARTFSAGD